MRTPSAGSATSTRPARIGTPSPSYRGSRRCWSARSRSTRPTSAVPLHGYLGILNSLRPPALGGNPELARSHFERAIELSGGQDLSIKVEYARRYARLVFDQELHDRLLTEVLNAPADAPKLYALQRVGKEGSARHCWQRRRSTSDAVERRAAVYVAPVVPRGGGARVAVGGRRDVRRDIKIATVAPDGSRWMQQMRAGAEQIQHAHRGPRYAQVLPRRSHGQRRPGAAQDSHRPAAGRRVHGRRARRTLPRAEPLRHPVLVPLARRGRCGTRRSSTRSCSRGSSRRASSASASSRADSQTCWQTSRSAASRTCDARRFGCPTGDQISFLAMQELGLSPVVLPVTDVLTGLQTGLIEIAFASPVAALVLQWHTKVKYITELPISYSMGIFAIEKNAFGQLSADDQKVVREVMGRLHGRARSRRARRTTSARTRCCSAPACKSVTVDAANVDSWRRTIEALYPRLARRGRISMRAMFDRTARHC